jgi:hypothetical protein
VGIHEEEAVRGVLEDRGEAKAVGVLLEELDDATGDRRQTGVQELAARGIRRERIGERVG